MKNFVFIGCVAAAFASPAFATTNLIQNGTFNGAVDWAELNDSVEWQQSSGLGLSSANSTGTNAEVLANQSPDTLYQDVSGLVIGETYKLTYLFGGRNDGGPWGGPPGWNASMITSFGGVTIPGSPISGSIGVWTSESFQVAAAATTERLAFTASSLSSCLSCGAEVTNVSLAAAAPETSTWAMMLAGFGALAFAGYRRKAAVAA